MLQQRSKQPVNSKRGSLTTDTDRKNLCGVHGTKEVMWRAERRVAQANAGVSSGRGWQQAARNEAPVIAIGSSLIHGIQLHLLALRIHKIQTEHTRPEHQSQHRETAKAAPCGEARRAVAATEAVFASITRPGSIIGPPGTALRVRGVSPRGLGKRGARAFFPQRRK
jgi:hypothetical protein